MPPLRETPSDGVWWCAMMVTIRCAAVVSEVTRHSTVGQRRGQRYTVNSLGTDCELTHPVPSEVARGRNTAPSHHLHFSLRVSVTVHLTLTAPSLLWSQRICHLHSPALALG